MQNDAYNSTEKENYCVFCYALKYAYLPSVSMSKMSVSARRLDISNKSVATFNSVK